MLCRWELGIKRHHAERTTSSCTAYWPPLRDDGPPPRPQQTCDLQCANSADKKALKLADAQNAEVRVRPRCFPLTIGSLLAHSVCCLDGDFVARGCTAGLWQACAVVVARRLTCEDCCCHPPPRLVLRTARDGAAETGASCKMRGSGTQSSSCMHCVPLSTVCTAVAALVRACVRACVRGRLIGCAPACVPACAGWIACGQ